MVNLLQANSNLSLAFIVAKSSCVQGPSKMTLAKKYSLSNKALAKEILLSYFVFFVGFYQQPLKSTMSTARRNLNSLSKKHAF